MKLKLKATTLLLLFALSSPEAIYAVSSKGAPKNSDKATLIKNQADIKSEVETLGTTVENLIGKVEENNFFTQAVIDELKKLSKQIGDIKDTVSASSMKSNKKTDQLRDDMEEAYATLSLQIGELRTLVEKRLKAKPKKKKSRKKKASKPIPPKVPAEEIYRKAYNDFLGGDFIKAANGFLEYIKRFPKTDLSDNSQYWAGESYRKMGKTKEAINSYLLVAERYPSSNKSPKALFKAAELQKKIGEKAGALSSLEKLNKNYPDSFESTMTQEMILELKKKK